MPPVYENLCYGNLPKFAATGRVRRARRPNNVATVTPVKVARLLGAETVIESGLNDGDIVVTEVTVRERKAGA
jgi:hypothetical protein